MSRITGSSLDEWKSDNARHVLFPEVFRVFRVFRGQQLGARAGVMPIHGS